MSAAGKKAAGEKAKGGGDTARMMAEIKARRSWGGESANGIKFNFQSKVER